MKRLILLAVAILLLVVPIRAQQQTLQEAYAAYNKTYFEDSLPANAVVLWGEMANPMTGEPDMGQTEMVNGVFHVEVSVHFHPAEREARITLLHEMCHVATWGKELDSVDGPHGPVWQDCMHHLAVAGAFDKLW